MKLLFAALLVSFPLIGHDPAFGDKIEEDWIKADFAFIERIIMTLKTNPKGIDQIFRTDEDRVTELGFGFNFVEGFMGKGYVSVQYQLLYKADDLISFSVRPELPDEGGLVERYVELYRRIFSFDPHGNPVPYYWNYKNAIAPIVSTEFDLTEKVRKFIIPAGVKSDVQFLMSPYSDIVYGYYGGYAGSMLTHRANFKRIESRLNPDIALLLLHSVNPATRLCAIEYLSRVKNNIDKEYLKTQFAVIYKVMPQVLTMSGCILHTDNPKKLVQIYLDAYAAEQNKR